MTPVVLTRQARQDILEAGKYYEHQVEGLGSEFGEQVNRSLERIETNPNTYQKVFKDFRRAPIHKFRNHSIWYIVLEDQSVVVACLSNRMHPALIREIINGIRPIRKLES